MHITMIGDDRLLGPLATLATRAGHTVLRVGETATDVASCSASAMMIVAGDRSGVTGLVARVAPITNGDTVIVDATTTTTTTTNTTADSNRSDGDDELASASEWMSLLPSTRIVRAFASVPAEAFASIVERKARTPDDGLAVPLAGDDTAAKEIVVRFIGQMGLEPFDLGPLTVSYVMEPGGALWGKAVDWLDMRECIGWLAGGG
jgi:predicted dinucleotide-binding enzyme